MKIAVIKYNAGNVKSVLNAFKRVGYSALLTDHPDELNAADYVVFPGQGEAASAMAYLNQTGLNQVLTQLKQPFLGICLGLQLLCRHTEENNTTTLGVLNAEVKRFPATVKVPHMGWNSIIGLNSPLFESIRAGEYFYFVHSYYAELCQETIAQADYGVSFSAAIQHKNYYAVQFHPEKSGIAGERLLYNFLTLGH